MKTKEKEKKTTKKSDSREHLAEADPLDELAAEGGPSLLVLGHGRLGVAFLQRREHGDVVGHLEHVEDALDAPRVGVHEARQVQEASDALRRQQLQRLVELYRHGDITADRKTRTTDGERR